MGRDETKIIKKQKERRGDEKRHDKETKLDNLTEKKKRIDERRNKRKIIV